MTRKSLSMHGIVVGAGPVMQSAAKGFLENATKLVIEGKIKSRENRYDGLREAGRALAEVHTGQSLGKPVIIAAND